MLNYSQSLANLVSNTAHMVLLGLLEVTEAQCLSLTSSLAAVKEARSTAAGDTFGPKRRRVAVEQKINFIHRSELPVSRHSPAYY